MMLLIVVLAAAATACTTAVVGIVFGRREAKLQRRLIGYERVDETAPPESDASLPTVQSAVDLTGRLAERTGILARVEASLESGDVPIRAPELIFYTSAFTLIIAIIVALLAGPIFGLLVIPFGVLAPMAFVSRKVNVRRAAFERQLPDTLTLLSSSLRAGFSFMQGLEAVAQEIGDPMRRELQRVFTEVRLGRAPEDALGDAAERMGSTDLAWAVMAIKIQREVGGNLATLLDTVADTMQKRDRLKREINVLTAEGRLSAIVLGLAPLAMGLILFLTQPDYINTLFDHTVGILAVGIGAVLAVAGYFWLRRIVDIEV
jgi:tight adherence protein B